MEDLSIMLEHNRHLLSEPTDLYTDSMAGHHILTCYLTNPVTQEEKEDQEDLVQAIKDRMLRLLQDCNTIQKITLELVRGEVGDVIVLDRSTMA